MGRRFVRIVCAVDFSPSSREALRLAVALARGGGALAICNVFERERVVADVGTLPGAAKLIDELRADAEFELEAWRRRACADVPEIESHALAGAAAWDAIVTFAEHFAADLVLVGAGARRHGILGSVAERVVRHAPCSVAVVAGEAPPLARLLCAVDFSPPARAATLAAADLAAERGAALALVHAIPTAPLGFIEVARQDADETLCAWAADAEARAHAPVAARVIEGPVAEGILEAARAGGHDLVIAGTHGRTGIARVLLGSVAERVVRLADRSVLVVRPSQAAP